MIFLRVRIVRILTAVAVVTICVLAMSRGWDIVRYSLAEATSGTSEDRSESVQPWNSISGLAFTVRESSLPVVVDWNDERQIVKRRDAETELLTVRPLSSQYWLLLSDMRAITGERPAKVAAALELSLLTGPNEGSIMFQRGKFGISQWEFLPADLQNRVAADLVAAEVQNRAAGFLAVDRLSNEQITGLRNVISDKPEKIRQNIRSAFLAQGISAQTLAALGL
jgi:hypothetical protein